MTNVTLAQSYIAKAKARLKAIAVLQEAQDYSDVVREAQEIVELSLKGMLRYAGIEPPKWHDVGHLILENRFKFVGIDANTAEKLAEISSRLRKERETAFYGDIDFVPSEEYRAEEGAKAIHDATFVLSVAQGIVK